MVQINSTVMGLQGLEWGGGGRGKVRWCTVSSKTLSITLLVELTLLRTTLLISTTLDVISLTWSLQIMLVVIPVRFCLFFSSAYIPVFN